MEGKIELSKREKDGIDIIGIEGIDPFFHLEEIENFIKKNIPPGISNFAVDFTHITSINSSGLALFLKIMNEMSEKNIRIVILNPNATVKKIFDLTRASSYFLFIKNESELKDAIAKA